MIAFLIFSFLTGAVFGLRFRIVTLLPATVVGAVVATAIGILLGQSFGESLLLIVEFAVILQIGYMFGSLTRFTLVATRAARTVRTRTTLSPTR